MPTTTKRPSRPRAKKPAPLTVDELNETARQRAQALLVSIQETRDQAMASCAAMAAFLDAMDDLSLATDPTRGAE